MSPEPKDKRVAVFVDGQNLFYNAKQAFGYNYPNYDVNALVSAIAKNESGWTINEIRFYTGMPDKVKDYRWNFFWTGKLAKMGKQGIKIITRPLRYRLEPATMPDGSVINVTTKTEKGIDVRLSLDVVRLALDQVYDVALIFSQDNDLREVAEEIRDISILQKRWIQVASAYPVGPGTQNKRGIPKTKWITFDQACYDGCIDPTDYRPPAVAVP